MTRTVMIFGDSNTHGTPPMAALGEVGRFDRATRWSGHFARALAPDWEVVEEGQPGRTTVMDDPIEGPHRNGLTVLPALLETHRPLDLVLIMLGTNNLKLRFSQNAGDIALSLDRLIGVVRGSNAGPGGGVPDVMIVAPPPIRECGCLAGIFEVGAAKSRDLGARMAEVAARAAVPFVDAGPLVAVSDVDGIHYDAAAHGPLGQALARAVRDHFG